MGGKNKRNGNITRSIFLKETRIYCSENCSLSDTEGCYQTKSDMGYACKDKEISGTKVS